MAVTHIIAFAGAWALIGSVPVAAGVGNIAVHTPLTITAGGGAAVTIGVNGDGGATTQLPAGWVAVGSAITLFGRAGGDQQLINLATGDLRAAFLAANTRVSFVWLTTPATGGAGTDNIPFPTVAMSATVPFRITLTCLSPGIIAPAAPALACVYVEYLWSASAGRNTV